MRHDSFICVVWRTNMCCMTHLYAWHAAFRCLSWLIHMWGQTHANMWHDKSVFATWPSRMWDMTLSYVWHDSFACITWLICMYNIWPSHMSKRSDVCVMCACAVTHLHVCVCRDSFACIICLFMGVTSRIQTCKTTSFKGARRLHSYVANDSFK